MVEYLAKTNKVKGEIDICDPMRYANTLFTFSLQCRLTKCSLTAHVGLELPLYKDGQGVSILLPLPPKHWNYRWGVGRKGRGRREMDKG